MSEHTPTSRVPAGVPTGGQFASSAKSEATSVSLGSTVGTPRFTPIGDCPDCGEPMLGHVGDGRFVPGASCEHCHHEVANHEWQYGPLGPSLNFHTYAIDETGYIRVTEDDDTVEIITPDNQDWGKHLREQGFVPDTFRRAHLAVNDRHRFVEEETARHGYAHVGSVYSVLLDRERVPERLILARAVVPETLAEDDEPLEDAIDRLYIGADCSEENVYDITKERWAAVEKACDEAGLGVMKDIYESMANREILHRDQAVDAEKVTQDYWNVVGPAIDRIEDTLLDEYEVDEDEQ